MPHKPEVRRYAPQVRSVFHFCYAFWHSFSNWQRQSHFFCTYCVLQAFFVRVEKDWLIVLRFTCKASFGSFSATLISFALIFILQTFSVPRERGGGVIELFVLCTLLSLWQVKVWRVFVYKNSRCLHCKQHKLLALGEKNFIKKIPDEDFFCNFVRDKHFMSK